MDGGERTTRPDTEYVAIKTGGTVHEGMVRITQWTEILPRVRNLSDFQFHDGMKRRGVRQMEALSPPRAKV